MEEIKVGARHSRRDTQDMQTLHDIAVRQGASCETKSSYLPDNSNALKTVGKTDDELRVANYIALFGGRDLTGFAQGKNKDGSLGEFFSPRTDFESEYTKTGVLYVDFEHAQDPDGLGISGDDVLGYVDWKTAKVDERGVFVERVLNRRNKYVQWLEELVEAGLMGNSTESIRGKAKRADNGEILAWPLRRDTLTVNPMEPRMLSRNAIQAVKALSDVLPDLKSIATPEATSVDIGTDKQGNETAAQPAKENFEMEKEEFKALLDENTANLTTVIEEKANAAATKAVKEFADSLPEIKAAMNIEVTDAPEDRPFKSIAENLLAVKADVLSHGNGDNQFPRLRYLKATGASEGIAADGGFLLEPTLVDEIIKPQHEDGPFSNDVRRLPVGANSNYGWLNAVDETSRVTGSRWGGIRGYRLAEAATKTASKPTFRRIQWELKKYAAVVVATDELLADSKMFSEIVKQGCSEELNFMLNEDIYDGVGTAGPQGFMNSGALISVTRTDANKILGADISAIHNRMDLRGRNTAKWYIGNDASTQLDNLFAVGSTAVLYPYGSIGADGIKRLYGRPIVTTEFNQTLGTIGDIVFADMNQYLLWEKGGIESATSIHVYFLSDETAFRFVMRVDGKAAANTVLTPFKGSTTTSPFVALSTAS